MKDHKDNLEDIKALCKQLNAEQVHALYCEIRMVDPFSETSIEDYWKLLKELFLKE